VLDESAFLLNNRVDWAYPEFSTVVIVVGHFFPPHKAGFLVDNPQMSLWRREKKSVYSI